MDDDDESQATQEEATQPLPAHNGVPASADEDENDDCLCWLHPQSDMAYKIVKKLYEYKPELVRLNGNVIRPDVKAPQSPEEVKASQSPEDPFLGSDIVLPFEYCTRDPELGFKFGRGPQACDVVMVDEKKYISNFHFRIYTNSHGVLMLEDRSTNGTFVDDVPLGKDAPERTRILLHGSIIQVKPKSQREQIKFIVRLPSEVSYGMSRRMPAGEEDNSEASTVVPFGHGPVARAAELPRRRFVADAALQRLPPNQRAAVHRPDVRPAMTGERWNGGSEYKLDPQPIGKGAFATVLRGTRRRDGELFAIKSIAKRSFAGQQGPNRTNIFKEVLILKNLKHENIVHFENTAEDDFSIYIIMEYVDHGDLGKYIEEHGTMDEATTKLASAQMLRAVGHMHAHGVCHRDLKPENVLIARYEPTIQVRISDFGLAKLVENENTMLKTFCGTMLYLAPEVFPNWDKVMNSEPETPPIARKRKRRLGEDAGRRPKESASKYSQACDLWSLGCVIFTLLAGEPPFRGATQDDVFNAIYKEQLDYGRLRERLGDDIEKARSFLQGLLCVQPALRISEEEALRHPWIHGDDSFEDAFDGIDEDEVQQVSRVVKVEDISDSDEKTELTPRVIKRSDSDENTELTPRTIKREQAADKREDSANRLRESMAEMTTGQPVTDRSTTGSAEDRALVRYPSLDGEDEDEYDIVQSDEDEAESAFLQTRIRVGPSPPDVGKSPKALRSSSAPQLTENPSHADFNRESYRSRNKEFETPSSDQRSSQERFEYEAQMSSFQMVDLRPDSVAAFLPEALENMDVSPAESASCHNAPSPRTSQHDARQSLSFSDHGIANLMPDSLAGSPTNGFVRPAQNPSPSPSDPQCDDGAPQKDQDGDEMIPDSQIENSPSPSPSGTGPLPTPWGRLVPLSRWGPQEPINLVTKEVSIGRSPHCFVTISDHLGISKQHAALQLAKGEPRFKNPGGDAQSKTIPEPFHPEHDMTVWYQAFSENPTKINQEDVAVTKVEDMTIKNGEIFTRERFKSEIKRIYDGDEITLFKDKKGRCNYRVELSIGQVKRRRRSN